MTNAEYHALPYLNASALKELARSPAHYWAKFLDPNREKIEPTTAMQIGTATHTMVLESEKFDAEFMVAPEGLNRAHKVVKELAQECRDNGKNLILNDEFVMVQNIAQAVKAHEKADSILSHNLGIAEDTILFCIDNIEAKARLDWSIPPCEVFPNGLVADLKTTANCSIDEFKKSIWGYRYDIQARWYQMAFMAKYETQDTPIFLFIACEKENPFAVNVFLAGDSMLAKGKETIEELLKTYKKTDWSEKPVYSSQVQIIDLPGWVK